MESSDQLRLDSSDASLLRAFEPVLRFTRGEYFYPVSVQRYVDQASLSVERDGAELVVAERGRLALSSLAEHAGPTHGVGHALSGIGLGTPRAREVIVPVGQRPPRLKGVSRLAAVGITGRLVDGLNQVSLLFRGSVPGGSAARSFILQRDYLQPERPTYYGRVIRDGWWVVCQYWFFYSFNNWRSGFGGVNEHEADWEQVTVFVDGSDEGGGALEPRWVVFSAHDESGDDLRRRWDDPDLSLVDASHPVVFAGAGSHSGAYLPGDYLITFQPPQLRGLVRAIRWLARILVPWSVEAQDSVGVPYVDYARGDGRAIGHGAPESWNQVLIGDTDGWVRDYRGLWGHDTGDRLGGERGPAGPRYERDGTVRESWADPVGWAGLAKVAPNATVEGALLGRHRDQIDQRLAELSQTVDAERRKLATSAAGLAPGSPEARELAALEERLLALRMEQTRLTDERERIVARMSHPQPAAPPHAHLTHRRLPLPPATGRRARFLSWWAALSSPLVLLALGVIVFPNDQVSAGDLALLGVLLLMAIEGLVRGYFLAVAVRALAVAASVVLLVLFWNDWRYVLAALFLIAAAFTLVRNVREASRR